MGKAKSIETTTTVSDIYERITARIVEQLEAGTRPWMQPWGAGGVPVKPLRHNGIAYTPGNGFGGSRIARNHTSRV